MICHSQFVLANCDISVVVTTLLELFPIQKKSPNFSEQLNRTRPMCDRSAAFLSRVMLWCPQLSHGALLNARRLHTRITIDIFACFSKWLQLAARLLVLPFIRPCSYRQCSVARGNAEPGLPDGLTLLSHFRRFRLNGPRNYRGIFWHLLIVHYVPKGLQSRQIIPGKRKLRGACSSEHYFWIVLK